MKSQSVKIPNLRLTSNLDLRGETVVTDKASQLDVISICYEQGVRHVIQESNLNKDQELAFSSLIESNPNIFFTHPISSIFGGKGEIADFADEKIALSCNVTSYKERDKVLAPFSELIMNLTRRSTFACDVLNALDELLMNAFLNLSTPHRDPNELDKIVAPNGLEPMIFAGFDDTKLVVGCKDFFGQLSIKDFLKHVQNCYVDENGPRADLESKTAGLGIFLIFNTCSSLYIGVEKGLSTTVCLSFPYKLSTPDRINLPKNLHIITTDFV